MAAQYVGILRAPTRLAFPRSITLQKIPRGSGRFDVVFWTEFRDEGFKSLRIVRELLARVSGPASSLHDAIGEFTILANQYAPVLATAANIVSGDMRLWLCFEQPSDGETFAGKQFSQSYDAGPQGLPTGSRWLDEGVGLACLRCFMKRGPDEARLQRAIKQYQQALLHWGPGSETLAVAHLWIAIEALTKVIERRHRGSLTSDQLAEKWLSSTSNG